MLTKSESLHIMETLLQQGPIDLSKLICRKCLEPYEKRTKCECQKDTSNFINKKEQFSGLNNSVESGQHLPPAGYKKP